MAILSDFRKYVNKAFTESNVSNAKDKNKNKNEKKQRILLIDGSNFFIRAQALSKYTKQCNFFNYTKSLLVLLNIHLKHLRPFNDIFISIDGAKHNAHRKKMFEDYKNGSKSGKKSKINIMIIEKILNFLNIKYKITRGYESDDLISFLVKKSNYKNKECIIVTTDKDYYQLITDNVKVYNVIKRKMITKDNIVNEYNITPDNFIFYKIIMGDGSDNIKGVKGVGAKSFESLAKTNIFIDNPQIKSFEEFISLLKEYRKNNNDDIKLNKIIDKILLSINDLKLNKKLMDLDLYEDNIADKEVKMQMNDMSKMRINPSEQLEDNKKLIKYYQNNCKNITSKDIDYLNNMLIKFLSVR